MVPSLSYSQLMQPNWLLRKQVIKAPPAKEDIRVISHIYITLEKFKGQMK
jgi:hypothetical protein